MPKSYKRHHNAGPVPYPDQSGKYLMDEVVTGDEWAPFVALDYVVEVASDGDDAAPAPEPVKEAPPAPPAPAPVADPIPPADPALEQSAVSEDEQGEGEPVSYANAREAQMASPARRKKKTTDTPSGENNG